MKKLIALCVLYGTTSLCFAQSCPSVSEFLVKRGDKYEINLPAGWTVVEDNTNHYRDNPIFRVAAWGDHKHPSDRVRCYYYQENPYEDNLHIKLETVEFIEEARIVSHLNWDKDSTPYHICVSHQDNVNECQFG